VTTFPRSNAVEWVVRRWPWALFSALLAAGMCWLLAGVFNSAVQGRIESFERAPTLADSEACFRLSALLPNREHAPLYFTLNGPESAAGRGVPHWRQLDTPWSVELFDARGESAGVTTEACSSAIAAHHPEFIGDLTCVVTTDLGAAEAGPTTVCLRGVPATTVREIHVEFIPHGRVLREMVALFCAGSMLFGLFAAALLARVSLSRSLAALRLAAAAFVAGVCAWLEPQLPLGRGLVTMYDSFSFMLPNSLWSLIWSPVIGVQTMLALSDNARVAMVAEGFLLVLWLAVAATMAGIA
jgi:hypothetical protein